MKILTVYLWLPFAAIFSMLASTLHALPADEAHLELTLDKSAYLLGEPFTATVRLIKQDASSLVVNQSFDFEHELNLYYRREGEVKMRVWVDSGITHNVNRYQQITVGAAGLQASRFFSGGPFAVAGRVEVQARYSMLLGHDTTWESNVVSVEVLPPAPNEAEAAKLWTNDDVFFAVANPQMPDSTEIGRRKIADLIVRYGNTRYGEFARETMKRVIEPASSNINSPVLVPVSSSEKTHAEKTNVVESDKSEKQSFQWSKAISKKWLYAIVVLSATLLLIWIGLKRKNRN